MPSIDDLELAVKVRMKAKELEHKYGIVRPPVRSFIPQQPTDRQKLFLDLENQKEVFYGGAAGGGKAEKLTEVIPTFHGWTTFGDVKMGDAIFNEQGKVCFVTRLYDVFIPETAYRMTFDDGSVVEVCSEHQWLTYNAKELAALTRRNPVWQEKRRLSRPSRATGKRSDKFTQQITARNKANSPQLLGAPTGKVRTTQEISDTLRTPSGRTNHAVPVAKALELPEADLPLDPYCFGAWLGDGSKDSGQIAGIDAGVFREFEKAGFIFDGVDGRCSRRINGFQSVLREVGVFRNKHIPAIYLRSSIEQRLALLQGLMDTDGTVYPSGGVEFTNTNKQIIDAVYELIVSLGWKARVVESRATLYGKDCGPKWDIKWTPSEYVFRLERKLVKQKLATRRTTEFRYIVACEQIAPEPMRCIEVDSSSRLFLCHRSMIPTHNSSALLMDALRHVNVPNYSALLLRRTYADLSKQGALMDRAKEWLTGTGANWNEQRKMWTFPSGARLAFGYLETENDKFQYQGAEYQYIGFDELSQFTETQYTYLFSRLRRLHDSNIPIRMRSGSNPGGEGAQWVKERFIPDGFMPEDAEEEKVWTKTSTDDETGRLITRYFVPARLDDNPYLDQEEYELSLSELDPVTRSQLRRGDWQVTVRGDILYMWSEPHHVITWSQFKSVFGTDHIPLHWKLGVFQDWGATVGHPCATGWFATAAENSPVVNGVPLAGSVFHYRSLVVHTMTARDVKRLIYQAMVPHNEIPRCYMWEMSHERLSERLEYNKADPETPYILPFINWQTGITRGIEQLKHALTLRDEQTPHPFKPDVYGHPHMYIVVSDDEYMNPKTDAGMLRFRQEAPAYKWAQPKSGETAARLAPHALFNDALDYTRSAAAKYFPYAAGLTKGEKQEAALPSHLKADAVQMEMDEDTKERLVMRRRLELDRMHYADADKQHAATKYRPLVPAMGGLRRRR